MYNKLIIVEVHKSDNLGSPENPNWYLMDHLTYSFKVDMEWVNRFPDEVKESIEEHIKSKCTDEVLYEVIHIQHFDEPEDMTLEVFKIFYEKMNKTDVNQNSW